VNLTALLVTAVFAGGDKHIPPPWAPPIDDETVTDVEEDPGDLGDATAEIPVDDPEPEAPAALTPEPTLAPPTPEPTPAATPVVTPELVATSAPTQAPEEVAPAVTEAVPTAAAAETPAAVPAETPTEVPTEAPAAQAPPVVSVPALEPSADEPVVAPTEDEPRRETAERRVRPKRPSAARGPDSEGQPSSAQAPKPGAAEAPRTPVIEDPDSAPQRIVAVRTRNGKTRLGRQVYRIQPGDTLSGIASRYGLSWKRLAALNDLADPDLIYAGDTLVLY